MVQSSSKVAVATARPTLPGLYPSRFPQGPASPRPACAQRRSGGTSFGLQSTLFPLDAGCTSPPLVLHLPTYRGGWHRPRAAAEAARSLERRGGTEETRAREPTPGSGKEGPARVRAPGLADTRPRGVRPCVPFPASPRPREGGGPGGGRVRREGPRARPPVARPPRHLLTLRLL